ncbi:hypothetical protein GJ689_06820 [Rhodoplanes serenus]|jgi:hypothetical protein|uniref:Uncharacterized protein n=1 Tax=Rhodoplanes serenus TaxID=200615 RepID=A0A447CNR8_9BRAD|nr:hypothetical protein [Rhodoplanes serenus]MTW15918.1 hypothetical protein [Rhodoplanes serenus]VCU06822.1 hypothetical protein RHODGE_RHODGE_00146 [Rhodoplanes serenus]
MRLLSTCAMMLLLASPAAAQTFTTGCGWGSRSVFCQSKWLSGPVAVAGQLDYVEMRKVSADERAVWQTRCRPRDVTDRYGVVHVVYAAAGCQYGP